METETKANTSTAIAVVIPEKAQALELFTGGLDAILRDIEAQARAVPRDISTAAGRKLIASTAHKIAKDKNALDNLGKELVADTKKRVAAIDAERRRAWDALEKLQKEVREPLDEYEQAEERRVQGHEAAIIAVTYSNDPASIEQADEWIRNIEQIRPRDWQEFRMRAEGVIESSMARIVAAKVRMIKAAQDAAELDRLRKEKAEREQAERDARIAEEAAAKAREDAERRAAEERARIQREADEKAARDEAERKRLEREKAEADARAKKAEADRKAAEKKAEDDRIAAEKRAAADREAAIEAERARIRDEERRKAEADAKRQANEKHRRKIHDEILADLMGVCGDGTVRVSADDVTQALIAGRIRHCTVNY